jgi:outer membrane receptor for ferrienterochelin and colicins
VSRMESPVPVEVYKPVFSETNSKHLWSVTECKRGSATIELFAIQETFILIEGPYTLVLIDGMPIVSGLSTVYGLSGIPNSLLERIEIVKGSSLWKLWRID